jgi:hypothetical protein
MKSLIIATALLAAAFPALAQNVSVSIGQPGFYGRIDLGNFAPAPVVYGPPVIVTQQRYIETEPVYLRVPPDHRRHWSRHCRHYGACGQRVLFVRDEWYTNSYVPRYHEHYRGGPGRHEFYRDHGPDYRHGGRGWDGDRGHDRGRDGGHDGGRERGHGDGRGHGHRD